MIISAYEPSLFNIFTAKSIKELIGVVFNSFSLNELEFLYTVIRLLETKNSDFLTTNDLAQEIVVDENMMVNYARKWKSSGVFYIEKYRPEYVCRIRDEFLSENSANPCLEYTDFINRIISAYNKHKAPVPSNKELAYLYSLKSDMNVSEGIFIEILNQFLRIDSSLKASDISSLIDFNSAWNSIADVQNIMSKTADEYAFVYKLMKLLGYKSKPTKTELVLYRKWKNEWGFANQDILETIKSLVDGDYPMAYLDGTLKNMYNQKLNEDLKKSIEEMDALKKILHLIGNRYITDKHITQYINLRSDYSMDFIVLAAEYASKIQSKNDKWYQIEKLLKEWVNHKLNTVSDIGIYEGKKEGELPF